MTWADALATPALLALLALLIAALGSGVMAGFGRTGVRRAVGLLAILLVANLVIANNVSEYGELGMVFALAATFFSFFPILIGWHVGEHIRESRNSRDKRHVVAGE